MSILRAKHSRVKSLTGAAFTPDPAEVRRRQIRGAFLGLGDVMYVLRMGEHIKIGWSSKFGERLTRLGIPRTDLERVLFVMPGTRADEHALHLRFAAHLARGREYFHPHADVLGWVNDQRAALRLPPVT